MVKIRMGYLKAGEELDSDFKFNAYLSGENYFNPDNETLIEISKDKDIVEWILNGGDSSYAGYDTPIQSMEWINAILNGDTDLLFHFYRLINEQQKCDNESDDEECDCGITKEDLEMVDECKLEDAKNMSDVINAYENDMVCINVELAPDEEQSRNEFEYDMFYKSNRKCDCDIDEQPYRLHEWYNFADNVSEHINNYTIPQYGDYPNDLLTSTSNECIVHDMKRYLNRFGKGQRGCKEAMRDMLKIAQYAGVLYNRLQHPHDDYMLKQGYVREA